MRQIPDDIMQAAYDCARGVYLSVDDAYTPYLTDDDIEVIANALMDERKATALRLADWIETQRKDIPAHGWEFAGAIRELCKLDVLRLNPSLSDRQYLEKIADQVIARNKPKAETSREASLAAGTVSAQSGAGVVSVCPALIDDVGGQ